MAGEKTGWICNRAENMGTEKQRTWEVRGKVLSVAPRTRRMDILLAAVGKDFSTGYPGNTTNLFVPIG